MRKTDLFVGRSGVLTPESREPLFFDRSGEMIDIPAPLLAGVQALTSAAFCLQCKHAHLIGLPTVDLASFAKEEQPNDRQEVADQVGGRSSVVTIKHPTTAKRPVVRRSKAALGAG
jgi:hypothetical protein